MVLLIIMQEWKWTSFFLLSIYIACIKMDLDEEFSYSETKVIGTNMEILEESGEISSEDGGSILDDENKFVRAFLIAGAEFRTALRDEEKIWKNGTVPFEISANFKKENRDIILDAMAEFHNKTCVRFIPRKNETSYIFIMPGSGCSAGIGRFDEANNVNLNEACFAAKGVVLHELMHTLGFIHEQNRPDRDRFVRIMFDNIREGTENNFDKYSDNEVTTFNQSYDYGSVMHYGEFDFAKNKSKPTIVPLQDGVTIGQRDGFSEKDLLKINLLYKCSETNKTGNGTQEDEDLTAPVNQTESDRKPWKIKRFRLLHLLSKLL